jgi:ATP-dependent Clp protease protease subunit
VSQETFFEFIRIFHTIEEAGADVIYLHINSTGGDLFAGFAMMDHLKLSATHTIAIVEGFVASAATLLVIGCTRRLITRNSFMLLHQPSSEFDGTMSELTTEQYNLGRLYTRLVRVYRKHTLLSKALIVATLSDDKYWSSKECVKAGIVHTIAAPSDLQS